MTGAAGGKTGGKRLDPRVHPYREEVAADWLEGQVEAARFVAAEETIVAVGVLPVREAPNPVARQSTELLYGERFHVYDRVSSGDGAWAWGQNQTDGYVGWVRAGALHPATGGLPAATHEVAALRSHLFPQADLKTVPRDTLHLTTRVRVQETEGGWSRVAAASADGEAPGGWLWSRHLVPVTEVEADPVAVARRFMGAPYSWGGRSTYGVDCSGLVQLALARCGRAAQRDSDQQEATAGRAVDDGIAAARAGDLLFMRGHVVFVSAPGMVLHANAHHMAVAEEPLDDFLGRVAAMGLSITRVRRPIG